LERVPYMRAERRFTTFVDSSENNSSGIDCTYLFSNSLYDTIAESDSGPPDAVLREAGIDKSHFEGDVIVSAAPKQRKSKRGLMPSPAVLLAAAAILPCGYALGKRAAVPYRQASQLRAQNDAKERKIADLEYKNQHTENEIKSLDSSEGIDQTARPLGWVSPGERPIVPPKN